MKKSTSFVLFSVAGLIALFAIFALAAFQDDPVQTESKREPTACKSSSIVTPYGIGCDITYGSWMSDVCRITVAPICQWTETTNEQECEELYEEYKSITSDAVPYDLYKGIRCWEGHNFFVGSNPDKDYDWFDSEEERCIARYDHIESLHTNPDVYMIPYEEYRIQICRLGSDSGSGQ